MLSLFVPSDGEAWRRLRVAGSAIVILVLLLASGVAARAEHRVALIIGESRYVHVPPLNNTTNDARLVASSLKKLGFELVGGAAQVDLDKTGIERAIRDFRNKLSPTTVGLFYYAGHGLQIQGVNYLVPVGANPTTAADADFELVDANVVLRQMADAGSSLNIVILDACRNNPFGGTGMRAAGGGLAQMKAPKGTLISYATQPGNVAGDGPAGGDSPYTQALVGAIEKRGEDLFQVFNEVGLAVDHATNGAQQPWVSSSPLEGAFYFAAPPEVAPPAPAPAPAPAAAPAPPPARDPKEIELTFWDSVKGSSDAAMFRAYLEKYPNGEFAPLARARVASLTTLPLQTAPSRASPPPRAGGFDGTWTGVASCGPSRLDGAVAFSNLAFTISGGKITGRRAGSREITQGATPTHFVYEETYDGQIAADGTVIITGQGRSSLRGYGIRFDGKAQGDVLDAAGLLADRQCTLHYTRQ